MVHDEVELTRLREAEGEKNALVNQARTINQVEQERKARDIAMDIEREQRLQERAIVDILGGGLEAAQRTQVTGGVGKSTPVFVLQTLQSGRGRCSGEDVLRGAVSLPRPVSGPGPYDEEARHRSDAGDKAASSI